MKPSILQRIKELGGNIENIKGNSLQEDILSIEFNTVLYLKPKDTPWAKAEETEPIYGIGEFVDKNKKLFQKDKQSFYKKVLEKYYCLTDEGYAQAFWKAQLFTPYKKDTKDFEEWNTYFSNEENIDLKEITKLTKTKKPEFIKLFYNSGYPDSYYICLSDPNPENPTIFGIDSELFFEEVTNEGNLEEFLMGFLTKDELLEILKKQLEK